MTFIASNPDQPKIFIVFGMPRTGTTYLYHALAKHPGMFVPYRKESHYFSVNYCKGQAWFASLYDGMASDKIGADINPMYFLDEKAIDRILAYDPDVKVVLGVRDPTDFAISLYGNMVAHGLKVPAIGQAVQDFDWPVTPHTSLRFSLGDGFMERRIRELQARFAGNLMLYDFAHFDRCPLPVLQAIERFVGVQPFFTEDSYENIRINASGRRNPFLLNTILANQRVLDALYAVVPRTLVKHARRAYERLSVRGTGKKNAAARAEGSRLGAHEHRELEEFFAADTRFYRQLFAAQPVLLPDQGGTPARQVPAREARNRDSTWPPMNKPQPTSANRAPAPIPNA